MRKIWQTFKQYLVPSLLNEFGFACASPKLLQQLIRVIIAE
ncbi:MAG: hypothetical protein ACI30B_06210 [Paludibacteraceae bacterium]